MSERTGIPLKNILIYALIVVATLVFLFPIFWLLLTTFKVRVDVFAIPPKFIFHPTLDNYKMVLHSPFMKYFANSLIIAVVSTTFSVVLGTLTAYGFSRYPVRRSDNLLFWILSLRMLPVIAVVVPFYILFRTLNLLDTHLALVLIYGIFNVAFTVWLMKGMFDEVPRELEEAAMMDGYSPLHVFLQVSLPQVWAGVATTAVFCLIQSLNEFLIALILTNQTAVTAPVGLAKFQSFFGIDWGQITAASSIFVMPILIFTIFVRNYLIRGLSFGRMK